MDNTTTAELRKKTELLFRVFPFHPLRVYSYISIHFNEVIVCVEQIFQIQP